MTGDNNHGRGKRVLDWSDERRVGNPIMVTLAHGWAFDPEDDESSALHVRGFDNVKAAGRGISAARPCRCQRCLRQLIVCEGLATLRDLRRVAKHIGATVEDDKSGQSHEVRVEAPKGHVWIADDIHEFVDSAFIPWKPDYGDVLNRMAWGVRKCADPNCEWCNS